MAQSMTRRDLIRNRVRVAISAFVVVLLIMLALGWSWTTRHQPPALSLAAHVVLSLAGVAGVFALARIWRTDS
jgi:membrane protein YdbS with pleckstrin-like domain